MIETGKALDEDYKSLWTAFKALENKKLVGKVSAKVYRNVEYPLFWLTEGGVYVALCQGINPDALLEKALKIYPENVVLHCLLEISPILGIKGFDVACLAVLNKGKIEQSDINSVIVAQMQDRLSVEDAKRIVDIIKKYPSINEQFKIDMQKRLRSMKSLEGIFE